MNKFNINTALSTLNIFLIISGYALITTLLLPVSSDAEGISRMVTIPFRAASLVVSLIVIALNIYKKLNLNFFTKVLLIFWGLYILKLFWVISVAPTTVASQFTSTSDYYVYALGVVFIPMISVIYSVKKINTETLFFSIYIAGLSSTIISMMTNNMLYGNEVESVRLQGNIALNSISYGHLAVTVALLSVYRLLYKKDKWLIQLFMLAGLAFSMYVAFLAGSRSPIIAFVFACIIMLFAKFKNKLWGVSVSATLILVLLLFWEGVNSFISSIAPLLSYRLESVRQGDTSDRILLYQSAWNQFLDNPLFGKDFVLVTGFGKGFYPHNIILESFMALGFIGGIFILILIAGALVNSVLILRKNENTALPAIIFLQYSVLLMFSGNIYSASVFFCTMTYVLQVYKKQEANETES